MIITGKNIVKNYNQLTNLVKNNITSPRLLTEHIAGSSNVTKVERSVQSCLSDCFQKKNIFSHKIIPFNFKGAKVLLTERTEADTAVSIDIIRKLPGYTDNNGNILPYLFVDGLSVVEKGKGLGRNIMEKIIGLARKNYGGRLLLKPENRDCNPSIFYYKCGLLSSTEQGTKEITNFMEHSIPFSSGYSDAMYLPIERI